jgi:hypothetical protein
MHCGGSGLRPVPAPKPTEGVIKMDRPFEGYLSLKADEHGNVYIHLGKEELDTIAQAVYNKFIEERNKHDEVSLRM